MNDFFENLRGGGHEFFCVIRGGAKKIFNILGGALKISAILENQILIEFHSRN